jgi:hypothetical protein
MRPGREPSNGWPASLLTEAIDLYKPIGHGLGTDDFLGAEASEGPEGVNTTSKLVASEAPQNGGSRHQPLLS